MRFEKGRLSGLIDDNGAFFREIAVGDEEVFRGVGFVVRDDSWGTPALAGVARLSEAGDGFRVELGGELATGSGDLTWSIVWTLAETAVEARVEWSSRSGFLTNRTGLVILHSLGASRGRPVRVTHPDGSVENASFPRLVSPHQPFFDIAAMDYETAAGNRLCIAVGGEVFEIEDQRNWSDASYKTYCRPLRLPFPYRIEAGASGFQTVRIEVIPSASNHRPAEAAAAPSIGPEMRMPLIGASLPPGPLGDRAPAAISELGLSFTAIELSLEGGEPLGDIDAKIRSANRRCRIDVRSAPREAVLECLRALGPKLAGRDSLGVTLFGADDKLIAEARMLVGRHPIGSGAVANFAELNRTDPLPGADYIAWASNPTVHGVTDDTIGETTETSEDILATIESRAPARTFDVGPLTLGARFDPAAISGAQTPSDPRQNEGIAAAWAVATLCGYLSANVRAVTIFEPFGPKGLMSASGALAPAGFVLQRLAGFEGAPTCSVRWAGAPRARGLLIFGSERISLCVAYARHDSVTLTLPEGEWRVEELEPRGFSVAGLGGRNRLRVGDFSVHWLEKISDTFSDRERDRPT